MVAVAEDWLSLAIGDNVNDSAIWTPMSGGAGAALVSALGVAPGVRSAAWESTTASGGFYANWTNQAEVFIDFYWNTVINSGSGVVYLARCTPNTDGVAGAELRISSGHFQLRNGTTAVDTSGVTAPTDGSWCRLRWHVQQTTGQYCDIFLGSNIHGTTPDETMTGAYTQGNVGRLVLGSPANPSNVDVSSKYSLININNSAFGAPYAGAALDTPTGFVFNRVANTRQIDASCTPVSGAVSYDLQVQYLSGSNPALDADWSALGTYNSATPAWTLTYAGQGIAWGESYRGRVTAKVS